MTVSLDIHPQRNTSNKMDALCILCSKELASFCDRIPHVSRASEATKPPRNQRILL